MTKKLETKNTVLLKTAELKPLEKSEDHIRSFFGAQTEAEKTEWTARSIVAIAERGIWNIGEPYLLSQAVGCTPEFAIQILADLKTAVIDGATAEAPVKG
jgi:hypothetical protein